MQYRVRLWPRAEKEFDNLSSRDRTRVLAVLLDIAQNPFGGKKLKGKYHGYYSARAWPYRIIYHVIKKDLLVLVIRIGHRQGVY